MGEARRARVWRPRPPRRSPRRAWALAALAVACLCAARLELPSFVGGRCGAAHGACPRRGMALCARQLSELEVGETLEGTVSHYAKFGCFVDVGAEAKGVILNEELSDGFAMQGLRKKSTVKARVLKIEGDKLWLTLRSGDLARPEPDPRWNGLDNLAAFEGLPATEWLEGEVHSVWIGKGVFVKVQAPGSSEPSKGLLKKEDFSDGAAESMREGAKVRVRAISCDAAAKRLDLSMREP
mmetsp:Transcript_54911/g.163478  ORF Transcript_54911/g.163478 Transcript_54911/m.163478 type:complete len:239 (+) Transcript_54911:27-743(+)